MPELSWSGIDLCLNPDVLQEWLDTLLSVSDLEALLDEPDNVDQPIFGLTHPRRRLRKPKPALNQLYYPCTASQWAEGYFLLDAAGYQQYLQSIGSPGSSGPQPFVATVDDPTTGQPASTFKTNLYALPPRPICGTSQPAYILPLVDERYFWSLNGVDLTLPSSYSQWTWSQLYTTIATALQITLTNDAISSNYLNPCEDCALDEQGGIAPILLDAVAANVGQVIVRNYDSTYKAMSAQTSNTTVYQNYQKQLQSGGQIAGDLFFDFDQDGNLTPDNTLNALLPSKVIVYFPKVIGGAYLNPRCARVPFPQTQGDMIPYTVNLNVQPTYQEAGIIGNGQTKVFYETCPAVLNAANQQTPNNNATLGNLSGQIALDYWDWLWSGFDMTFGGSVPWTPEGSHNLILTFKDKKITTRVRRLPWNGGPDQMLHWDTTAGTIAGCGTEPAFIHILGGDTPLFADMTATQTFLIGKNGAPFPVSAGGYYALIDAEIVQVGSFQTIGFSQQTQITRGQLGTTATGHTAGAVIRAATYLTAPLNTNDRTISFPGGSVPTQSPGNVLPSACPYVLWVGNQNAQQGEPVIITGGTGTAGVYTCERLGFGTYAANTPLTVWVPYTGNTCYGVYGPGGMRQGSVTQWNLVQNQWQDFATVFVEPAESTCDPFYVPLTPGRQYSCMPSTNLKGVVPTIGMPLYQAQADEVSLGAQQYGGLYHLGGGSLQNQQAVVFSLIARGNSPTSYIQQNVSLFGWPGFTGAGNYALTLPQPGPSFNASMPGWLVTVNVYWSNYGILQPGVPNGQNQPAGQFIEVDVFQVPQVPPGSGQYQLNYFPPVYDWLSQPVVIWTNPPYTQLGVLGATVPTWTWTFQTICQPGTYAFGIRTSWQSLPGSFTGNVSVMPFPLSDVLLP